MYEYESEILTVEDLMDMLSCGKNTIYRLLSSGAIKAFRVGRVWKIPRSMLDEFIVRSATEKMKY